jgi:Transposase
MNDAKYIGLDVHQATISAAVLDSTGKLVMECVLETKASIILQFIHGLRGSLHVTFEEGTCAAWLHDLLKPHVTEVLVCNPRKNALLKVGNKSDRIDAGKLAELLYLNKLSSVYHGENGVRTLKELARSYLTVTKELSQVMNRLKAVYRSWAIPWKASLDRRSRWERGVYRYPLGYGAEEPPAFCPRTQAFMFCQSGSSSDANCLPPWWVSARPPASGASGIRRNRLKDGSPGTTSFETTSKLWRDCSSVQKLAPTGSMSRLRGPPP